MTLPNVFLATCGRIRRAERGKGEAKKNVFPRWLMMRLSVLLAVILLLASCDDTVFDPFQESDLHFSLFGYLDAGVDTQFVRITSVRDSIALRPGPIDATVTLKHLDSGHKIVWDDSLFAFRDDLLERIAYNFWSAEPLVPNTTYRLTVTRSDGAVSAATVALPDTFPAPRLDNGAAAFVSPIRWRQSILVTKVDRLAALQVVYTLHFPGEPPTSRLRQTVSYLTRVRRLNNGLGTSFDAYEDLRAASLSGSRCPFVLDATVIVAAANPDWPDFENIDPETLARPDVITNVENGIGFVGGIVSQTIPWPEVLGALAPRQQLCAQLLD